MEDRTTSTATAALQLPILPLDNKVLFPRTYLRLSITSSSALQLLKDLVWEVKAPKTSRRSGGDTTPSASLALAIFTRRQAETEPDALATTAEAKNAVYSVGTMARVVQLTRLQGGVAGLSVLVQGLHRVQLQDVAQTRPYLVGLVQKLAVPSPVLSKSGSKTEQDTTLEQLTMRLKHLTQEYLETAKSAPLLRRSNGLVDAIGNSSAGELADVVVSYLNVSAAEKQSVLEAVPVALRCERAVALLEQETEKSQLQRRIQSEVQDKLEGTRKEFLLRQQLEAIKKELGEAEDGAGGDNADADHYGLDKVKKRITEYIAVRSLKRNMRGPILCLVGPPGVGKTSLGRSIATATNRKFERVALGGVHDESEIRGHRKTYVGAMPGCILNALRHAETNNPVLLLDEVDKLGKDFRGDPANALLEVLDPHQNNTFTDHYLNVPFDLSHTLFLATANSLDTIPGPLLDRMEVIELSGYSVEQKAEIAKRYLLPQQIEANGLRKDMVRVSDEALRFLIMRYTREAGVRDLERQVGALCRFVAVDVVRELDESKQKGQTSGKDSDLLASFDPIFIDKKMIHTILGHELVFNEVALRSSVPGVATGVHIHFPEGAIPKDGPSAGGAIVCALLSVISVGGIREKVLAAIRAGIKRVILPRGNKSEAEELRKEFAGVSTDHRKDQVQLLFVSDLRELIQLVFHMKMHQDPACFSDSVRHHKSIFSDPL
ncbi:hypothetical protein BBO99_00003880 [Phytophthora kernoviae]|uniref:Lon N-terminal domain-containing protein n=2 Tax=Phytophthora kernoviae TaxID=325452 RepID=A0A3R7KVE1_9STRA|nr:hypothetical protein G195_009595 [Phytophthora kernoviae 00238/432]KAG2510655.1 hypothetical protein JM16_008475 [Phytophthora kernoviae]KAG2516775.1 hypothetical protein JM18_007921 [Phytophthora kernoviae]RLN25740.1 hypothetical protein BBI17_003923 [Phytophthora kernoviae]RLN81236.1 hypothetical protein BBO99_00003880 [Phytophthora kernoviae]